MEARMQTCELRTAKPWHKERTKNGESVPSQPAIFREPQNLLFASGGNEPQNLHAKKQAAIYRESSGRPHIFLGIVVPESSGTGFRMKGRTESRIFKAASPKPSGQNAQFMAPVLGHLCEWPC